MRHVERLVENFEEELDNVNMTHDKDRAEVVPLILVVIEKLNGSKDKNDKTLSEP